MNPVTTIENIHTVYVKVDNRPGSLERIAKALGEKRINIDAISVETVGSTGFARLVTNRPNEAVEALRHARLEAYDSPALLVALPNRPAELGRACAELSAAGINIEGVITTADGRLVVRTHDNERAAQILRKL